MTGGRPLLTSPRTTAARSARLPSGGVFLCMLTRDFPSAMQYFYDVCVGRFICRFKATKQPSQQSSRRGPVAASGEGVDKYGHSSLPHLLTKS